MNENLIGFMNNIIILYKTEELEKLINKTTWTFIQKLDCIYSVKKLNFATLKNLKA